MRYLGLFIVFTLLTATMVYGLTAVRYSGEIGKTDEKINRLSLEIVNLSTRPLNLSKFPPITSSPIEIDVELTAKFCFDCHDKGHVESFHYPEMIKQIEEKKGRPVRICTNCHGSPVMPVHFEAIQEKRVQCDACHLRGEGGFTIPEKREEDLLICQLCHARGNYITIHVEGEILQNAEIDSKWITTREGNQCTICHNEDIYRGKDILDIHSGVALEPLDISLERITDFDSGERNFSPEDWEPSPPTVVITLE